MIKRERAGGKLVLRRPAYVARDYAVAPETLDVLQKGVANWTYDEALRDREGMFNGWMEVERTDRDGTAWALLYASGSERCIEVEIRADGSMGRVRAVPPERAYEIAKTLDAKLRPDMSTSSQELSR